MGDPGRRGRLGGVPFLVSKLAEEYASHLTPPYDIDDIISAFESGFLKSGTSIIPYEKKHDACFTRCPFGMVDGIWPVLVASNKCKNCENFVTIYEEMNYVYCKCDYKNK